MIHALVVSCALAAGPAPFDVDDYLAVKGVESPQLSPDGTKVAYVVGEWAETARVSAIWLVPLDKEGRGGTARKVTAGAGRDRSPRWSPDGKSLAFVSDRKRGPQIHVLRLDGGEAEAVTEEAGGADDPQWSPDGKEIAFTTADAAAAAMGSKPSAAAGKEDRGGARVDEGDEERGALKVVTLDSRKVRTVVAGGGHENVWSYAWSPDGGRFVLVTSTQRDNWFLPELRTVLAAGGPTALLGKPQGPASQVSFSPDGQKIVVLHARNWAGGLDGISALPSGGGKPTRLAQDRPLPAFWAYAWEPSGKSVVALGADGAKTALVRIPVDGGATTVLATFEGSIHGNILAGATNRPSLDGAGKRIALAIANASRPAEVMVARLSAKPIGELTTVTSHHAGFADRYALGPVELVRWKGWKGEEIEGVLTRPAGGSRPAPLVFLPHGGPEDASHLGLDRRGLLAQVLATHGFAVLQPNFHASVGYGPAFTQSAYEQWGAAVDGDFLPAIDYLQSKGVTDGLRTGIWGHSFGGYAAGWLAHSGRLTAVVAGAGVHNLPYAWLMEDGPQWEFSRKHPWDDPALFAANSPIAHAASIKVPLLLVHGEADGRVPPQESLAFARAIRDAGGKVTLVTYPGEGHGIDRERKHSEDYLRRAVEFLEANLRGRAAAAAPPPVAPPPATTSEKLRE